MLYLSISGNAVGGNYTADDGDCAAAGGNSTSVSGNGTAAGGDSVVPVGAGTLAGGDGTAAVVDSCASCDLLSINPKSLEIAKSLNDFQ